MSCLQQNFPSKFEPNYVFYEKLEENTFVTFIMKQPVYASEEGGGASYLSSAAKLIVTFLLHLGVFDNFSKIK